MSINQIFSYFSLSTFFAIYSTFFFSPGLRADCILSYESRLGIKNESQTGHSSILSMLYALQTNVISPEEEKGFQDLAYKIAVSSDDLKYMLNLLNKTL